MSDKQSNGRTSRADRDVTLKILSEVERAAVQQANCVAADNRADLETRLSRRFREDDEAFADITEKARMAYAAIDAEVSTRFREMGIDPDLSGAYRHWWIDRGENSLKERRAELRRAGEARIEADLERTKCAIKQEIVALKAQVVASSLTSEQAKEIFARLPSPDQLMPRIGQLELRTGELIALPPPAGSCNGVTDHRNDERNGVTDEGVNRKTCQGCGQPLSPGRGLYCSNACRQAAYRARKT